MAKRKSDASVTVTEVPLSAFVLDPENARQHPDRNARTVEQSVRDVGFARSIVVVPDGEDEASNRVLAGNLSLQSAQAAGLTKGVIIDVDGQTVVAVRRRGLTETQQKQLALADNRAGELATWNQEELQRQLRTLQDEGISLDAMGWLPGEWRDLTKVKAGGASDELDRPAKPRPLTTITRGDAFRLGEHIILCGDSRDPESIARVMRAEKAVLLNTDPPYGVDYAAVKDGIPRPGFRSMLADQQHVENDDLVDGPALQTFLETVIRSAVPHLSETCAFYFWHPMLTQGTFFAAAAADILIHRQIIWVKPHMVLTRSGMYHWKHELCFYGWRRGHRPPWYGDKGQVSVWEVGPETSDRHHPTQKPVELFLRPIRNHCRYGEVIYEPFLGSGSQVIAAEQAGVSCRAIEIDPVYVQQAIDRWEAFSGKVADRLKL